MNAKRLMALAMCGAVAMLPAMRACAGTGEEGYFDAMQSFHAGLYSRGYSIYLDSADKDGFKETSELLYYIGYCYETGQGPKEKDASAAEEYYRRASDGGSQMAKQALMRLAQLRKDAMDREIALKELAEIRAKLADEEEKYKKLKDDYAKEEEERQARLSKWEQEHKEEIAAHNAEIKRLQEEKENAIRQGKLSTADAIDQALKDADAKHQAQLEKLERARADAYKAYEATIKRLKAEQDEKDKAHEKEVAELNAEIGRLLKLIGNDHPLPPPRPPKSETQNKNANDSPFGFAMFAPAQFPPVESDILGFRLSVFYGRNNNVFGLDVGTLASVADGDLMGLEISGLFNLIDSSSGSIQIGGIANICEGDFLGLQIGGITEDDMKQVLPYIGVLLKKTEDLQLAAKEHLY